MTDLFECAVARAMQVVAGEFRIAGSNSDMRYNAMMRAMARRKLELEKSPLMVVMRDE